MISSDLPVGYNEKRHGGSHLQQAYWNASMGFRVPTIRRLLYRVAIEY